MLLPLGFQVAAVVGIDAARRRQPPVNLDSLSAQRLDLERIVGHEINPLHVEAAQDLRRQVVASKVIREAKLVVGLVGVGALGLQRVGAGSCFRGRCRALPGGEYTPAPRRRPWRSDRAHRRARSRQSHLEALEHLAGGNIPSGPAPAHPSDHPPCRAPSPCARHGPALAEHQRLESSPAGRQGSFREQVQLLRALIRRTVERRGPRSCHKV